MLLAIVVLSAFVLGVGAMVKQTRREQSEQPPKPVGRAGITPIYKRSSPMDMGGGVGYVGGATWTDGGSGGFDGGSCGSDDGGSGGDSGGC